MPIALAVLGAGIVGAGATAYGASKAADAQKSAAAASIAAQQGQYNTTRGDLMPYQIAGRAANDALTGAMPYLTSPIALDQASLEQTPGYQFNLSQGLKSVQNGAAARGLGSSGAAMKGAAQYATGLADNTYLNQFNMENQNRQNIFNRLLGVTSLGESAAAGTGAFGANAANATSNALTNAGNAQGAAYMTGANAITNAANNAAGMYTANALMGGGMFGNGGAGMSNLAYNPSAFY